MRPSRVGSHNRVMISPYWPLSGLRLKTPRLELRWPTLADLDSLAALAADGVHDPSVQPFAVAWTDAPPHERARGVLQYHWSKWGSWSVSEWELNLVAARQGVIIGTQGLGARDFAQPGGNLAQTSLGPRDVGGSAVPFSGGAWASSMPALLRAAE
jgi:RimJ/RimL family protein N-acetyltransferase